MGMVKKEVTNKQQGGNNKKQTNDKEKEKGKVKVDPELRLNLFLFERINVDERKTINRSGKHLRWSAGEAERN